MTFVPENSKSAASEDHRAIASRVSALIRSTDLCRISTIGPDGWPHLVPVSYVHMEEMFYIPADRGSKKVRNLRSNPKATILIDVKESESGVMIECEAAILRNEKAKKLRDFIWTEKGWRNDETTVVIALRPLKKAFWSLKQS